MAWILSRSDGLVPTFPKHPSWLQALPTGLARIDTGLLEIQLAGIACSFCSHIFGAQFSGVLRSLPNGCFVIKDSSSHWLLDLFVRVRVDRLGGARRNQRRCVILLDVGSKLLVGDDFLP